LICSGFCASVNKGWWIYEWCHRQKVHQVRNASQHFVAYYVLNSGRLLQFHLNPDGKVDPDWSLGNFETYEYYEKLTASSTFAGPVQTSRH
jgi:hypothetical protein